MTVARLTFEGVCFCVLPPFLLRVGVCTPIAVVPGRIMLALALEQIAIIRGRRADKCVAVAHAAGSNTDLLDGVVVLRRIMRYRHERYVHFIVHKVCTYEQCHLLFW